VQMWSTSVREQDRPLSSYLPLVRRRGRYAQIGLFGKPIAWDLDQVCYRELGCHRQQRQRALVLEQGPALMASGSVNTKPLITHRFPVTDWSEAFAAFESKQGVKTLLTPAG
jgi:L-iditol 2-dehydrogenase